MSQFEPLSRIVGGLWRLGAWKHRPEETADWTRACLELGIDSFDLADIYGDYRSEVLFGAALAAAPRLRDELRIVTKTGIKLVSAQRPAHTRHVYDTSAAHIAHSVENSLRALATDRIDLLLIHRQDPLLDPHEVARAFDALHASGKVLAFGTSNFTASHFAMLASYVDQPLVTNQVEASLLHLDPLEDGTFDQALERRARPMAWSPLAGGRLFHDSSEHVERVRGTLTAISAGRGVAPETVACAFLLRHPAGVHPITGSGRLERIRAMADALAVELTREEWFELYEAGRGTSIP